MRRVLPLLLLASCLPVDDVEPRLIPGGGVADAPLRGTMNVYVIDDATGQPIPEAEVYIGEPGSSLFASITDVTGLWRAEGNFNDPEAVTVGADGYETVTLFGVDASNVTVPLRRPGSGAVPKATLGGTIAGFDALPEPAADHLLLAGVSYSVTRLHGGTENALEQPRETVCGKAPGIEPMPCEWFLDAPAGEVMLWAPILDVDTNGTLTDPNDDVVTAIGYAVAGPITVEADVFQGEIVLEPVTELVPATITHAATPGDRPEVNGFVGVDMGARGILLAPVPMVAASTTIDVPALSGPFADASYVAGARARSSREQGVAESWVFAHGITDPAAIMLSGWMDTPRVDTFSNAIAMTPLASAGIHIAEIRNENGSLWWTGIPLDGRTDLTFPENLMPIGPSHPMERRLELRAFEGEVDLREFSFGTDVYAAPRISSDVAVTTF